MVKLRLRKANDLPKVIRLVSVRTTIQIQNYLATDSFFHRLAPMKLESKHSKS